MLLILHNQVQDFVYAVVSAPLSPSPYKALIIVPVDGLLFQNDLSMKLSLFRELFGMLFCSVVTENAHDVVPIVIVPILVV